MEVCPESLFENWKIKRGLLQIGSVKYVKSFPDQLSGSQLKQVLRDDFRKTFNFYLTQTRQLTFPLTYLRTLKKDSLIYQMQLKKMHELTAW